MVYMSSVLEMYEKLIGSMLSAQPTPSPAVGGAGDAAGGRPNGDVRTQLSSLLKKVQNLRRQYYQEEDRFRERLTAVREIQVEKTQNSQMSSHAVRRRRGAAVCEVHIEM